MRLKRLLSFQIIALVTMVSLDRVVADELPLPVKSALGASQLPSDSFGAFVLPIGGGNPDLSYQGQRLMAPGSTMKLLASQVALDTLGPTFKWRSRLLTTAKPQGDTLQGDLYLRGGGDPDFGWDKLAMMLRKLRSQGIRRIQGDLVIDRQYFQPARADINAPPFDSSPDAYYNVIPDAMLVGSNLLEVTMTSTPNAITVSSAMPLAKLRWVSEQKLVDAPCDDWEDGWQIPTVAKDGDGVVTVTLHGTYPRNCTNDTSFNVLDRNVFIERLVAALWQELGGEWRGNAREGVVPANATLLVEQASDTLADIVKRLNKHSDNVMARMVYLTLGAEQLAAQHNEGETLTVSQQVAFAWLAKQGIRRDGIMLENGSGLSRIERMSPQQMGEILFAASHSNWFAELSTSLPIVAIDGTMRRRLRDTAAAGRARIKTGTLGNVVAVAGYVRDIANRDWIVVGFINHPDADRGRPVLDTLINWVASRTNTEPKPSRRER